MRYYMFNKPSGCITARKDDRHTTVFDYLKALDTEGLFPVGRLDKDTTGLLLISNDGKLAHKLLSPTKHVDKVYELTFDGVFKNAYHKYFAEGIVLDDGYKCMPATFELLEPNKGRITIKEGKYHQVKRMMQALNMEVTSLKRIEFGPLSLPNDLEEGKYRELTVEELELLKK